MTGVDRLTQVQTFQSPYLLTGATDRRGIAVAVTADATTAMVDMVLHGPWSHRLRDQVSATMRLCVAGPTDTIIIDLLQLDDPHGVSLSFWLAAWRQARLGLPSAQIALCLPTTTTLGWRLRNLPGPQPRVFATAQQARIAIADRMSRADRLQSRLPAEPASARAARDLVTQACHTWHLPTLLHDTLLIASELATNAVQHARTDLIITVSRANAAVHVAVHDGVSQFPHPNEPGLTSSQASLEERGRGLRLVHRAAAAWGAMPALGGKVVWATVK